jgi:hypothetical protein
MGGPEHRGTGPHAHGARTVNCINPDRRTRASARPPQRACYRARSGAVSNQLTNPPSPGSILLTPTPQPRLTPGPPKPITQDSHSGRRGTGPQRCECPRRAPTPVHRSVHLPDRTRSDHQAPMPTASIELPRKSPVRGRLVMIRSSVRFRQAALVFFRSAAGFAPRHDPARQRPRGSVASQTHHLCHPPPRGYLCKCVPVESLPFG